MKSNELMLWDWVYVPHKGKAPHYGRVTALLSSGAVEVEINGSMALLSSVKPISLTTEILKKNGFEYVGSEVYECDVLPFYIWWERDRHRLGIDIEDSTYDKENFAQMLRVPVSYVHELQHCLKLVGIDKEITI